MRVLIVEDDRSSRILLHKYLLKMEIESVAVNNGIEAIEELKKIEYDVVITDWLMPEMDGLELIQYIRKNIKPNPSIIVTTAIASAEAKRRVLLSGADDYFAKPINIMDVKEKIDLLEMRKTSNIEIPSKFIVETSRKLPEIVGVGIAASTGGPPVLMEIFKNLEYTENAAFFVVLHGPAWMLKTFSERVQQETNYKVFLGQEGQPVKGGEIYFAPGDFHMKLHEKKMSLMISDDKPENFVKPAADPLFRSLANTFSKKTIGVVLTGMGKDGTIGSGYIAASGGIVIAQNPKTASLPSMPQSVVDLRIARSFYDAELLPEKIIEMVNKLKNHQ
ncbi:MAG: chemotaxis protein CheB [Ignavibacteria bacterium]|nr:chemotaxis protein CheB [Ignavibacteria bacterium]